MIYIGKMNFVMGKDFWKRDKNFLSIMGFREDETCTLKSVFLTVLK